MFLLFLKGTNEVKRYGQNFKSLCYTFESCLQFLQGIYIYTCLFFTRFAHEIKQNKLS